MQSILKNPNLFVDHLLSIHKNEISWNIIKEIAKKDEISKNMIEYIKRLTYKMTQLFPFDDELLQFLSCLSPKSFNFTNWKLLANRYTNIISEFQNFNSKFFDSRRTSDQYT